MIRFARQPSLDVLCVPIPESRFQQLGGGAWHLSGVLGLRSMLKNILKERSKALSGPQKQGYPIEGQSNSSVRPRYIRAVVTAGLLIVVFRSVDIQSIRESLIRIQAGRLAALLLVHWVCQMVTAQRWRVLAQSMGMRGSYWTYLRMHFVGMFFSAGLPSLVGGDAFKAYMASRQPGGSLPAGIASVLQDRAAGLMILLAYGTVAVLFCPLSWRGIPLVFLYLACWAGGVVVLLVIWKGERLTRRWVDPNASSIFRRVLDRAAAFHQNLAVIHLSASGALQVILLSLANSSLVILIIWQVCIAFGYGVNPAGIAALVPITDILMMVPITVSGVGVREWAYLQVLPLLGIPPGTALAAALTASALLILRNLGGAVFLPTLPAALRRTSKPSV
jgi:uncharacterized protein (TIRG00374 family)